MSKPSLICLSLSPNLRCFGFTIPQFATLIIPPVIEVIISLLFIYLCSGPDRQVFNVLSGIQIISSSYDRRAQFLLAVDGILYFIWALLDVLSHVVPAARNSLSLFKVLDFLLGAVSFTPILLYTLSLYRLSFQNFLPAFPRNLQPYLEISLPLLLLFAVAINEVSSFVGTYLGTIPNQGLPIVEFSNNSETLWFSLSRSSLAIYTVIQFLFFLLAFSRLSTAFLDQRRIELTHSDEHHYYHGMAWITTGIILGVIETIVGFSEMSFGITLTRRILRLISRTFLMYGLLKGLDVAENFETLPDELRGVSSISKRISHMLGANPQRKKTFHRFSQTCSAPLRENLLSQAEKQRREQRVTVHYEKGQAPSLEIRFSSLDFPAQAILADMVQQRRGSLSGLIPGLANAGSGAQRHQENLSHEMAFTRNSILDTRKAKPAFVDADSDDTPDWIGPPDRRHVRQGSGGTVSDNLSIVRDLERRFPSLPPRVTGKYRGSILGQNYEEDPYPVIGISRQSSLRHDGGARNQSEGGATSTVALSSSGSIKRKPAPPLLDMAYISDPRTRRPSTWGGLNQTTPNYTAESPMVPNSPWETATGYSSDHTLAGEPSTPRSRRLNARNLIQRASRALSDASIRSAEWLASARVPRSDRTPLTAADIQMYRRGALGPGSAHPASNAGEGTLPGDNLTKPSRRSADDIRAFIRPDGHPIGAGRAPLRIISTPTHDGADSGHRRAVSSYATVNLPDG
ncbi:hypothetical protein JVU11DRAFT_12028 [Chiua virens]|nr:hypothetical protein JVU11DRAFT_12786 [Chiua virens]KAG9308266.1 hypothetical protein JVU11DRAFT_12028 [Chiua virens]